MWNDVDQRRRADRPRAATEDSTATTSASGTLAGRDPAPGRRRRARARPAPTSSPSRPVAAIAASGTAFVRTTRHPSAAVVPGRLEPSTTSTTSEPTLDDGLRAHRRRARRGRERARRGAATPCPDRRSSPSARSSCLRADGRVEIEIVPGAVVPRPRRGPGSASIRSTAACASSTASAFAVDAAGERGPLLVAPVRHARRCSPTSSSPLDDAPPDPVVVLQRLGLPDEQVFESRGPSSTAPSSPTTSPSLWIPTLRGRRWRPSSLRFAELVRTLRAGVPVGRGADPRTLTRHLLEETYEPRGDRRPSTPTADDRSTTSRRSSATCSSRWSSTRRSPPRRAGSRWPTSPAASTTSSCAATRTCSATSTADSAERGDRQLGADQEGREGPTRASWTAFPRDLPVAALRPQGAAQGRPRSASTGTTSTARSPKVDEELDELRRRSRQPSRATSRPSSATCSSPSSTSPGTSTSTRRPRSRRERQVPCSVPGRRGPAAASGRDLSTMTSAELDALWDQAKR